MQIHDELRFTGLDEEDETGPLNVVQMIDYLRAVEFNMIGDSCLGDLAGRVAALRIELEDRRKLAFQVAAEIEAESCLFPN